MDLQKKIEPHLVSHSNDLCTGEVISSRLVFDTVFDPPGKGDFFCERFWRRDRAFNGRADRKSTPTFYADPFGAEIEEFGVDRIAGDFLDFELDVLPVYFRHHISFFLSPFSHRSARNIPLLLNLSVRISKDDPDLISPIESVFPRLGSHKCARTPSPWLHRASVSRPQK